MAEITDVKIAAPFQRTAEAIEAVNAVREYMLNFSPDETSVNLISLGMIYAIVADPDWL